MVRKEKPFPNIFCIFSNRGRWKSAFYIASDWEKVLYLILWHVRSTLFWNKKVRQKKHHSRKNENIQKSTWQKFSNVITQLLSVGFLDICIFRLVVFFWRNFNNFYTKCTILITCEEKVPLETDYNENYCIFIKAGLYFQSSARNKWSVCKFKVCSNSFWRWIR